MLSHVNVLPLPLIAAGVFHDKFTFVALLLVVTANCCGGLQARTYAMAERDTVSWAVPELKNTVPYSI